MQCCHAALHTLHAAEARCQLAELGYGCCRITQRLYPALVPSACTQRLHPPACAPFSLRPLDAKGRPPMPMSRLENRLLHAEGTRVAGWAGWCLPLPTQGARATVRQGAACFSQVAAGWRACMPTSIERAGQQARVACRSGRAGAARASGTCTPRRALHTARAPLPPVARTQRAPRGGGPNTGPRRPRWQTREAWPLAPQSRRECRGRQC